MHLNTRDRMEVRRGTRRRPAGERHFALWRGGVLRYGGGGLHAQEIYC